MWNEIKAAWRKQWEVAKDAWECAWDGCKATICNALYAIANFIWAVVQTVIFMPIKTAIYDTGCILLKYLIEWIKRV